VKKNDKEWPKQGGEDKKITRAKESQTQLEGLPEKLAGKPFLVVGEHQATSTPNGSTALNQPDAKQKTYKTTEKNSRADPVHSELNTMQLSENQNPPIRPHSTCCSRWN